MRSLVVSSWNVLADDYMRPEYYPWSPAAALEPARRRAGIIERLRASPAQIICLQEVDAGLLALLGSCGFTVCKSQKRGKPDWIVTLVRGPVQSCVTHEYQDGTGHIAVTVEAHGLRITNTHLKWDGTGDAAAREVHELLPVPSVPWILCGDLNAEPHRPALEALRSAGLIDAYATLPDAFTANSNGKKKRIDFLLHTASMKAAPVPLKPIDDQTPLPDLDEPSDHLMVTATFTLTS